MPDLLHTLNATFGFDGFRPLQREIIEATLAGRDVFALLPTGGGKSLCFQLPALVRPGLTVVVSPLIALMKDQVDQMQAAGVAATYLNSTLDAAAARSRLAGLHRGEWRLLYVAPERLMLDEWKENLKAWNVSAIVIDEAHCIAEWGHDFRPEYQQLGAMAGALGRPTVLALTATADPRTREMFSWDLVGQGKFTLEMTFLNPGGGAVGAAGASAATGAGGGLQDAPAEVEVPAVQRQLAGGDTFGDEGVLREMAQAGEDGGLFGEPAGRRA